MEKEPAHLALGSHPIASIDPDILGDDGALLLELEIFLQLSVRLVTLA